MKRSSRVGPIFENGANGQTGLQRFGVSATSRPDLIVVTRQIASAVDRCRVLPTTEKSKLCRREIRCGGDANPMRAGVRRGVQSSVESKDVLELLHFDSDTTRALRRSTIPPPATLHAIVGRQRFEVASLTPLEALLHSTQEVPESVPCKAEVALELRGTRVMKDIDVEFAPSPPDSRTMIARFANVRVSAARAMIKLLRQVGAAAELPRTREKIRTLSRIETVLKALVWSNAKGHLVDARGRRAQVSPVHFEMGEHPLIVWQSDRSGLVSPFQIKLQGPWSAFSFRVTRSTALGALLVTDTPSYVVRTRRRVWRRVDDRTRGKLAFAHPIWPEIEVTACIEDVSYGGIALRAESEAMLLFPGLQIPKAQIADGPAAGLIVQAQVCHVGGRDRDDETKCGLSVEGPPATNDAWVRMVRERLYPHTSSGATPFGPLWTLYGDSGYLTIADGKGALDTPAATSVDDAIRLMDAAPEIAVNVVWPSRVGVTGAITLVKLHEHTWFGQHMAKRSGATPEGWHGRQVLREMHLHAYEHALRDKETRWLLGYVRHDAGWPKLVHVAFPQRAKATGRTCVVPFRATKVPCATCEPVTVDPDVLVQPATDDDLLELATILSQVRPAPYLEALDLVEERMRMSTTQASWSRAGLMRERTVLIASRDGHRVGAGVFEATSDGVHVFGLLDCARLFALDESDGQAFRSLLVAARTWFAEHGRPEFVYLAEDDSADLDGLNAKDMGMADATVTPIGLLPDLLEHMWEVTESPPILTM
jgi:hypothetical protein